MTQSGHWLVSAPPLSECYRGLLRCPVLSLGGGNETAGQNRRQSGKNATPRDVEAPQCAESRRRSQFPAANKETMPRGSPANSTRRESSRPRPSDVLKVISARPATGTCSEACSRTQRGFARPSWYILPLDGEFLILPPPCRASGICQIFAAQPI